MNPPPAEHCEEADQPPTIRAACGLVLAETGDALSRDRSILDQFERRSWAACPRRNFIRSG